MHPLHGNVVGARPRGPAFVRPSAGRTVTAVLGAAAVNDFLQSAFSYCAAATSTVEKTSEAYNGGPISTTPFHSRTS